MTFAHGGDRAPRRARSASRRRCCRCDDRDPDPGRRHQSVHRAAAVADPRRASAHHRRGACAAAFLADHAGDRCGRACFSPWSALASASSSTGSGYCGWPARTGLRALAAAPIVLMYPLFLVIFGRNATTIVMIGFAAGLAPVILKTVEGLAGTRPVLLAVGRSFRVTPAQQFRKILLPAALPSIFVGMRLGLDLRDDQHRRRRVPDQLRRPRPAHQRARRAVRPPRDLRRDPVRHPCIDRVLRPHRTDRAMAATRQRDDARNGAAARVAGARSRSSRRCSPLGRRWRRSGWLFRDVVPSLGGRSAAAMVRLLAQRRFLRQSRRHRGGDRCGARPRRLCGPRRRHPARREPVPVGRLRIAAALPRADAEDHLLPRDDHVVRRRRGIEDRDGRALVLLPDRDQRRRRDARDRPRAGPRRPELSRIAAGRW